MRLVLILSSTLILCSGSFDEVTLSGRLIWENNEGIPETEILLYKLPKGSYSTNELVFDLHNKKDKTYKTTKTDKNGKFSFTVESDSAYCYLPLTDYHGAMYGKKESESFTASRHIERGTYILERIYVEKGKNLDLGELTIERQVYKVKFKVTIDGKPLHEFYSVNLSRTDDHGSRTKILAGEDGYEEWKLERNGWYWLFENKEGDYSAFAELKPGKIPFESVTQEVKLSKGKAKLKATAVDKNGNQLKAKTQLYLLPAVMSYPKTGFDQNIKFSSVSNRFIFKPDFDSTWNVENLPPGEYMAAVMTEDFKKIFHSTGPTTVFKLQANKTTEIEFSHPQAPCSLLGSFDPSYSGIKLSELIKNEHKHALKTGRKDFWTPKVGIYLAKLSKDGNYHLAPDYPDAVFSPTASDCSYRIENIYPGDYFILAGGVGKWLGPKGDLIGEYRVDLSPFTIIGPSFFPVGKVTVEGKETKFDISTDITPEFTARVNRKPISVEKAQVMEFKTLMDQAMKSIKD